MGTSIRLNLGSGRHYWPGFVNIDGEPPCDRTMDVTKLDYPDNSVEMIYAIHLFEHLPRQIAEDVLLEWKRVLVPNGKLVLEMPCMNKIAKMIVEGETDVNLTLMGIFGDWREASPAMLHKWCYTETEILHLFMQAGFVSSVSEPFYHKPKRDMRITGVKV